MRFVMVTTNIYHPLLKNELLKSKQFFFALWKGKYLKKFLKSCQICWKSMQKQFWQNSQRIYLNGNVIIIIEFQIAFIISQDFFVIWYHFLLCKKYWFLKLIIVKGFFGVIWLFVDPNSWMAILGNFGRFN